MQPASGQPSLDIPQSHVEHRRIALHPLSELLPSGGDIIAVEMEISVHEVVRLNDEI